MIPKPDGGERELGIPTVTDRLIQQALLQVLQPLLDPTFSEHSYGFRPGRNAHGAMLAAQRYVASGRRTVVDVDLEKFFDRVDHDILIDRLSKRIADRPVIRLVRAYLDAGTLKADVVEKRRCGAPQGGPLSPLLANVLLDEWIRHRLRAIQLKHWKRGTTTYRELRALGASEGTAQKVARNARRWWRNSYLELNRVLNIAWFDRLGLPRPT